MNLPINWLANEAGFVYQTQERIQEKTARQLAAGGG